MTDEKHPLRPSELRKPSTKKGRNWQQLEVGYTFPNSQWTLVEMPYRKGKVRRGSQSFVMARCGGCQRVLERRLYNLVQGSSKQCTDCHQAQRRAGKTG